MNSLTITEKFNSIKKNNQSAFIPYFILGYPDLETSYQLIKSASQYCDIIELGIPFSDPIADGKTIQNGVTQALKNNISLNDIFSTTKRLTSDIKKPFIYMMYYNQIYGYGINNFINKIKDIGIQGLIVPDLLPDSDPSFNELVKKNGIDLIFLMTPTTEESRIPLIVNSCSGFIYFVAVVGITGERNEIDQSIIGIIEKIKSTVKLPICVGFGISTINHVKNIYQFADGAIVGSAIVKKITENLNNPDIIQNVTQFIKELNPGAIDG